MKSKLTLFLTFLKIGAFTFGGGYAMIALIRGEFVDKKKWIGNDEFTEMIAIAESTPGPMAINSATYIGYKIAGFFGALLATLAVSMPAFTFIFIISLFYEKFKAIAWVSRAFAGIQVCVVYLILSAGVRMLGELRKNAFNIALLAIVLVLFVAFSVFDISFSSVFFILICGVLGLVYYGTDLIKKGGRG
ncbi:MAG: chromate transporter [Lachnospiraceae bacterium]|nr:chromate transporter [Lachnospiraceae bacterium]